MNQQNLWTYDDKSGVERIKVIKQPDALTCGPTCLAMICEHLEFHPEMGVHDIAFVCGTNAKTGTTDIAMKKGLEYLGLKYERPRSERAKTLSYLRQSISDGNIVILRTLMPGGYKHWVLLHAYDDNGFHATCPSMGKKYWKDDFIYDVWSKRDFDCFSVPRSRREHKDALRMETEHLRKAWKPIHEMDLKSFLMNKPVIPNSSLTKWHHNEIKAVGERLKDTWENKAISSSARKLDYKFENYSFFALDRNGLTKDMLIVDENDKVVAGISRGTTWVDPSMRGKGIGKEMVIAAHSFSGVRFLYPSSYSENGYHARVAAHKEAVRRALINGLDVPIPVLVHYSDELEQARDRLHNIPESEVVSALMAIDIAKNDENSEVSRQLDLFDRKT